MGIGDDNGAWIVSGWSKQASVDLGEIYHYPAWLTRPTTPAVPNPNSVAGYPVDWAAERVDGCVANAGATPEVDVLADPATEGISQADGCECGLGYKVYAYLLPRRGGQPPVDRVEGWHEPPTATGEPQTITPLGEQTTITVDSDETTEQDFFLSVRLVTDDGFATRLGSANSFRVECPLVGCSGLDRDADGFTECDADCDDLDSTIMSGAAQICDGRNNDCSSPHWPALTGTNEFDDDCDRLVDEDDLGQDTDGDGVHNLCDNCREAANPAQSDTDGDEEGDVCDLDDGMIYILFHRTEYVEWQEESGLGTTSGGEARPNSNPCP